jgi:alpha/beta superfamily hydrolase
MTALLIINIEAGTIEKQGDKRHYTLKNNVILYPPVDQKAGEMENKLANSIARLLENNLSTLVGIAEVTVKEDSDNGNQS